MWATVLFGITIPPGTYMLKKTAERMGLSTARSIHNIATEISPNPRRSFWQWESRSLNQNALPEELVHSKEGLKSLGNTIQPQM
jgi:hypothetical protein